MTRKSSKGHFEVSSLHCDLDFVISRMADIDCFEGFLCVIYLFFFLIGNICFSSSQDSPLISELLDKIYPASQSEVRSISVVMINSLSEQSRIAKQMLGWERRSVQLKGKIRFMMIPTGHRQFEEIIISVDASIL